MKQLPEKHVQKREWTWWKKQIVIPFLMPLVVELLKDFIERWIK